jgi:hypothetical protein
METQENLCHRPKISCIITIVNYLYGNCDIHESCICISTRGSLADLRAL